MPPTTARPEVGMTMVVNIPPVVVLPAPLGPSRPKISPRRTSRLSWSTAGRSMPGYTLVRSDVRMTTSSSLNGSASRASPARATTLRLGKCPSLSELRRSLTGATCGDGAVARLTQGDAAGRAGQGPPVLGRELDGQGDGRGRGVGVLRQGRHRCRTEDLRVGP